ncbi:unnamed protein product [Durusdinium trenchii]|uniref:Uncharacterized protein n=1 Tax=Durusdinium trenchii TaxID=1381693 RepID=A0ABP0PMW4_9DINO
MNPLQRAAMQLCIKKLSFCRISRTFAAAPSRSVCDQEGTRTRPMAYLKEEFPRQLLLQLESWNKWIVGVEDEFRPMDDPLLSCLEVGRSKCFLFGELVPQCLRPSQTTDCHPPAYSTVVQMESKSDNLIKTKVRDSKIKMVSTSI